ncbi:MAG: DNA cytosine methyltransferase, partial [Bacteroidetes bacterium]|nr:DNA cytosine methyltransferase [Bacteroidota bacterium]
GELNTKNAISDLPALLVGEGFDNGLVKYQNEARSAYQIEMRDGSRGIMNHRARPLNKWYDKKIYAMAIEKAKKNELIKYQELPKGLKKHSNEKHFQDRFKVHWWSKIPHTIVAHISKDGHYNIHPDIKQLRSLTVREAARIQSFPDNFKFEGPRTAQYVQVGNAVPPKMAKAFAINLKNQLRS